jgi:selenium-binding protein 1
MPLDETFFIDFGREPDGPACAHEIRLPSDDWTSEIRP